MIYSPRRGASHSQHPPELWFASLTRWFGPDPVAAVDFVKRAWGHRLSGLKCIRHANDGFGHLKQPLVLTHGCLSQERVGILLGQTAAAHQHTLGALDRLALGKRDAR